MVLTLGVWSCRKDLLSARGVYLPNLRADLPQGMDARRFGSISGPLSTFTSAFGPNYKTLADEGRTASSESIEDFIRQGIESVAVLLWGKYY